MKSILLGVLIVFASFYSFSQDTYTFKIKDTKGKPISNVLVTAVNGDVIIKETTDATGTTIFTFSEVGVYKISYLEKTNIARYEVREGFTGNGGETSTYDPKNIFAVKPTVDRSGIVFKTVNAQTFHGNEIAATITLSVKEKSGRLIGNIPIEVVSITDKIKYTGKTNASGKVIFYLPINRDYEVDVEGNEAITKFNVPNYKNMRMSPTVFYTKTKVDEIAKGDTLIQKSITQTSGTSTHVLFTLNLKDYDGKILEGEPVFAQAQNSKLVYEGVTNSKGKCQFMLKKGADYVINLKHESGIHLVEAPSVRGYKTESASRRYRGSELIERLKAEKKAEMERLQKLMEQQQAQAQLQSEIKVMQAPIRPKPGDDNYQIVFEETPVEPISEPADYLTKTPEGFNVDFSSAGPASTPTIVGDKMYTQEGIYSSNYYCLHAKTGQYEWGLELGESGISPAVYHNGVLLINTASCTLYAIDAKTGELLWSKWLADYVYSTPTADDDNVYVVYSHGGYPVLVSFGLRSGTFNWMQRVDDEAIACPVIDGSEVHVASQSGTYYVFDKESGEALLKEESYKVVSSPTITEDKIYITATVKGNEKLVALDRKTLKIEKEYPVTLNSLKISGDRDVDETDQMNFNGSHPIVYKNEYVIVMDASKIRVYDIESEKLLWNHAIEVNSDQLPIITNGRVIITSSEGDVMSYDLKKGTSKVLKKVDDEVEGQPITKDGFIYIAAGGLITVIKSIGNFEWEQWNKDASHNTVWR
jgi:outer membrane protein assembly factor BamB